MKKITTIFTAGLLSIAMLSPAIASDDDEKRTPYQEHYKQRHQMNIDMMQMLSETMTILRDINHQPSAAEKARLSDMIKQLDEMMVAHKKMQGKIMQRMDKNMGDSGGHHGKHWGKN